MDKHMRGFVEILEENFDLPEPIWDIGSYCVPGQEELANVRSIFAHKEFLGIDMRAGPGVDRVENIENISAADESVGTILCLNTLEHVENMFAAAGEMHRVIRQGGILILTTPFNFPIHNHPGDYWRFTPQALLYLTRDFSTRLVGHHGYELTPRMTFAVAFKSDNPDVLEKKLDGLKARFIKAAYKRKGSVGRRIKMALAQALVGKKYFYNQNHFGDIGMEIVCQQDRNES